MGWNTLAEFEDRGVSGKEFTERPSWQTLLEYVRALPPSRRKQTAVVMWSIDRFARDVSEGEVERKKVESMGLRLRFAMDPYTYPEDQANGWMTFVLKLVFATFERLKIIERTKAQLSLLAEEGHHLGEWPGGDRGWFTKDAEGRIKPSALVERVVDLRLLGKSYSEIASAVGEGLSRHDVRNIASYLRREVEREDIIEGAAA